MGSGITLTAADGHRLGAYRADPAATNGGIVIVQEIFGVNSHIRSVADAYAAAGYRAVAPALFDRVEPGVELGYDEAGMARGRALSSEIPLDDVLKDVAAAAEVAAQGGKAGVVGYCWGGAIAWAAACRLEIAAAVGYYGRLIYDLREERPACPVMLHYGEKDLSIPLDQVEAVRQAHPEVQVFVYPGAEHGFNCDARVSYQAEAAELARARSLDFLATNARSGDDRHA